MNVSNDASSTGQVLVWDEQSSCIENCFECSNYWNCERTVESRKALAEIKGFSQEHPGKRYRENYGKSKRRSAARAKVKR